MVTVSLKRRLKKHFLYFMWIFLPKRRVPVFSISYLLGPYYHSQQALELEMAFTKEEIWFSVKELSANEAGWFYS